MTIFEGYKIKPIWALEECPHGTSIPNMGQNQQTNEENYILIGEVCSIISKYILILHQQRMSRKIWSSNQIYLTTKLGKLHMWTIVHITVNSTVVLIWCTLLFLFLGREVLATLLHESKQMCYRDLLVRYACAIQLLFLFKHLYPISVWFGEDHKTNAIKTHI